MTATVTTSAGIEIEHIVGVSRLAGMEAEWQELLEASDSDCLFLTWGWLHTWWKHLAEGRSLQIVTVREDGQLIAVAPFCERPASLLGRRLLPVREFLGTGFVGSDYLDVIVRRGSETEARAILSAELGRLGTVFDWGQLRRGRSFAASIAESLGKKSWTVRERAVNVCPYISLAGLSFEEYLGTLGSEHRYNFNRKWRRLQKDHTVHFEQILHEEQCAEAIDLVVALHNARWQERGESDAFHTPALVEFHREFAQLALNRGWLRLYVLRVDEKPAACLYGFLYARKFYFYQSGLDPAYQKQSVGLVSMGLGIRNAISNGAEEYDLLHGDEEYKGHWAHERRELARIEAWPPSGLGLLDRQAVDLERSSRRLARRVITKIA